jgi:glycerophosphoryl diester phosphodiesterase
MGMLLSTTVVGPNDTLSVWLAGVDVNKFPGDTLGERIAHAAASIKATTLSPAATDEKSPVPDPSQDGYIPFTTEEMIKTAHSIHMTVKPWTVGLISQTISSASDVIKIQIDRLNLAQKLLDWGVDGIITDYSTNVRTLVKQNGLPVAPQYPADMIEKCLKQHLETTD